MLNRILSSFNGWKIGKSYKQKISTILASQPSAPAVAWSQPFWSSYPDTRWHRAYASANGIVSDNYVPEDLFYVNIEPKLNPCERAQFYSDKNNLDKLRFPCVFPKTLGRLVAGKFLAADYRPVYPDAVLSGYTAVVVKPSLESGGGRNVAFMSGEKAASFAARCLREGLREEYIFQEPIEQSSRMAAFAPDSVNTIRVMTMLDDAGAHVLSSVLRMGRKGVRVDNQGAGGIACGISRKGRLITRAYDKSFKSYLSHPDTAVTFSDTEVPGYGEADSLCRRLHVLMPEMGLLSWDVAIDLENKPIIIEINILGQEINFHQVAHGPLFGDRLSAVVQRTQPRLFMGCPVG